MINTVSQERVAKLINNKTVEILDVQYCKDFYDFVTAQSIFDLSAEIY